MNIRGKATWVGISFIALIVVAVAVLIAWRAKLHHERTEAASGIVTIYTCPMHPEIVTDAPGKCPICGMELIPIRKPKEKVRPDPDVRPKAMPPGKEQ